MNKFFFYLSRAFSHIFSDMRSKDAIIVCFIPVISIIFCAFTYPVFIDEVATAIHYVTGAPFYYSLIHYPEPNNHVLHSLLLNITDTVSPFDLLITVRIPAVVGSIFTCFLLLSFLKSYFKENTALLIVGISSMLHYTILYSFLSRGYYLVLLFFIICLYAVFNILRNNQKKDWAFFIISSILGFYTMPSFLYVFIILNVILLFKFEKIKRIIISGAIVGITSLLLYSPIMISDGIDALVANKYVIPKDRMEVLSQLPEFLLNTVTDLTGINGFVTIGLLLLAFIYILKSGDKWKIYLFAVFILAPFVLLLLHSVIPFYRTFNYYNFIFVFLIVTAFSEYIDKIPKKYILIFVVIAQIGLFLNFYSKRARPSIDFGYEYNWGKLYAKDIGDENLTFYINIWWFEGLLDFEKVRRNQELKNVERNYTKNVSADTLNNYNYIFLNPAFDKTTLRKPDYSDPITNIYINKKE